jgi:hypothetical protein
MEYEFQTTIESADVTITFDYQPEEAKVLYYSDGSGYPGCAASIDGYGVTFETKQFNSTTLKWEVVQQDITDLMEQLGYDIEELCFEHIETLAQ